MVTLLLLLLSLQSFNQAAEAEKKGLVSDFISAIVEGVLEAMNETGEEYDENIYNTTEESLDWLLSLLDDIDECDPNPCYNNGTCENAGNGDFKCICPRPFKGRRCQDVINMCMNVKCGRGECTLIDKDPFYECKCYAPFQPPNCRKASSCNPSPCLNGGTCVKGRTRTRFHCECPENYSGKFCQVGPKDCYEGDGSSYRGFVSETVSGDECLPWNSHLIMKYGPFDDDDDGDVKDDGIGPHNYCRNPDGESQPWCFIKYKTKLRWDDCNVTRCHEPSSPTSKTTLEEDIVKGEFSECGKPRPSTITSRIFGGRKSKPGAYPWQASVQTRLRNSTEDFSHFCGGTLLNSCWVLTAAHCIDNTTEMQVVLGGVDLMKEEAADQTVEVEYYIMHENYTSTDKAVYNDIALLKLKPVSEDGLCARETRFVKAACLPPGPFPDEMTCTISGYGVTETGSLSKQLLDTKVLLINQSRCMDEDVLGEVLDDSTFCAGRMQGGVDTCQGDSGGPLSCKQNDIHYIYGVVSWGYGCGIKSKPGVYARVTHFIDWINEKMHPL
ncbi:hyaluronan-binding protein 2 [Clarias gariepinus]|uniref:hyaluronan-binding protein 2-like n=1 Tax=Clarias gariepinus TaxID=13013 RepID=UPI00234CF9E6|nr:hyaluronan-binding protein 2-like [Clarias gariepinus]